MSELGTYKLPKGWKWTTIPDLVGPDGIFIDGDWVESKDQDPNGDVRLIQLADVGDGIYRDKSSRFLTKNKASELRCTFLKSGDILVARMPDPLGRACVFPGDAKPSVTVVDVCIIRSGKEDFNHRWLSWFVNASPFRSAVAGLQAGSTRKRISRKNLGTIFLPLPPLIEQRFIVAEIEKQFTRLEAGVAALKRVQANLKRYRAAVLKAACEGRLVPTEANLARKEGRSYETGDQLLARILTERRRKWQGRSKDKEPSAPHTANLPLLPEGWTWATVAQIGETTTGFTPSKQNAAFFGGDIPFFKPTDLDAGYYVRNFRDSLTIAGAEQGRVLPARSILVTCIGATIGKTGFSRTRCTTNQQINALTVSSDHLSPEFVFWFFTSPLGQCQITENASATTLPILNKSRFEVLPIPIPPLAEQKRIVAEVERRLSVVEEQEAVVSANLQRAIRLSQSILRRAFTGHLSP